MATTHFPISIESRPVGELEAQHRKLLATIHLQCTRTFSSAVWEWLILSQFLCGLAGSTQDVIRLSFAGVYSVIWYCDFSAAAAVRVDKGDTVHPMTTIGAGNVNKSDRQPSLCYLHVGYIEVLRRYLSFSRMSISILYNVLLSQKIHTTQLQGIENYWYLFSLKPPNICKSWCSNTHFISNSDLTC